MSTWGSFEVYKTRTDIGKTETCMILVCCLSHKSKRVRQVTVGAISETGKTEDFTNSCELVVVSRMKKMGVAKNEPKRSRWFCVSAWMMVHPAISP